MNNNKKTKKSVTTVRAVSARNRMGATKSVSPAEIWKPVNRLVFPSTPIHLMKLLIYSTL